jgi:dGTPase
MREHGGYNHNHQSYRIVTSLERRYPAFPGLNLTYETLEGIAKHETDYHLSSAAGLDPTLRGSLEAQIANFTDELAYNAHDLDDGLRAGLLLPEDLDALDIWRLLCERLGWNGGRLDELTRHVFIRELIGLLVDDTLRTTDANLSAAQPQSSLDIQRLGENVVCFSPETARMVKALKAFLFENMYYSFRIARMKQRAERFIELIFTTLVDEPRQLPRECQADIGQRSLHRVIADYIASMTDRGALLEYRHLYDPLVRP